MERSGMTSSQRLILVLVDGIALAATWFTHGTPHVVLLFIASMVLFGYAVADFFHHRKRARKRGS